MSDDRTTATGFARQFKDTAQNAGPPPRPKPAPPAATRPTPEPEPTHPNSTDTVGEGNEAKTTPAAKARKNAASQPAAEPAEPVTAAEDEEYIPTGFQLSLQHIQRIQDYADQHRVFRQIAFEELIEQAITNLGGNPTIPPAPKRRGPDDYEYRRQLSVRIRPSLLTRLDQLAEQNARDGRSHVVRHLLSDG